VAGQGDAADGEAVAVQALAEEAHLVRGPGEAVDAQHAAIVTDEVERRRVPAHAALVPRRLRRMAAQRALATVAGGPPPGP
jgi:hypothetical protein